LGNEAFKQVPVFHRHPLSRVFDHGSAMLSAIRAMDLTVQSRSLQRTPIHGTGWRACLQVFFVAIENVGDLFNPVSRLMAVGLNEP
jgi:hypothetical protein